MLVIRSHISYFVIWKLKVAYLSVYTFFLYMFRIRIVSMITLQTYSSVLWTLINPQLATLKCNKESWAMLVAVQGCSASKANSRLQFWLHNILPCDQEPSHHFQLKKHGLDMKPCWSGNMSTNLSGYVFQEFIQGDGWCVKALHCELVFRHNVALG